MRAPGCKTRLNQALSVLSVSLGFLWLCVVLLTRDSFQVVLFFMLFVCSVAWLFLLGCQYQCKWLTGKTRLRNDLQSVDGDVKPYSLTHSLSKLWTADLQFTLSQYILLSVQSQMNCFYHHFLLTPGVGQTDHFGCILHWSQHNRRQVCSKLTTNAQKSLCQIPVISGMDHSDINFTIVLCFQLLMCSCLIIHVHDFLTGWVMSHFYHQNRSGRQTSTHTGQLSDRHM